MHRQCRTPRSLGRSRPSQRGVVLLFALIALLVLLIGATALIRSFNTSLFMAGNIGFKRDLQNQGERAVSVLTTQFQTGNSLATRAQRSSDNPQINYSAKMLQTDAQGIPLALTSGSDPGGGFTLAAPELDSTVDTSIDPSIKIRYVLDRLCATSGDEKVLGTGSCAVATTPSKSASGNTQTSADGQSVGGTGTGGISAVPQAVLYRLSIRITGPRNTQSFFQSTFSVMS